MQLNYYVLGQRIQKIRKNKRISQAVLSTMIDKSAGYISYLECGTKVLCPHAGRSRGAVLQILCRPKDTGSCD